MSTKASLSKKPVSKQIDYEIPRKIWHSCIGKKKRKKEKKKKKKFFFFHLKKDRGFSLSLSLLIFPFNF